jgi:hypothetical protein
MFKYFVVIFFVLAFVGILMAMPVQQRIVRQYGMQVLREKRFVDVYWYGLTKVEKWYFWVGFVMTLLPFAALGVWRGIQFLIGG